MNLLSLIIVFLALLVCGAIAYIAWELTSDRTMRSRDDESDPGDDRD